MSLLTVAEEAIIIKNYVKARDNITKTLEIDRNNVKALELATELSNVDGNLNFLIEILDKYEIKPESLAVDTNYLIGFCLDKLSNDEKIKSKSDEFLSFAKQGRVASKEIVKVALSLRRLNKDEEALDFLKEKIEEWPTNASMLDLMAKINIDLAKNCIDSAKNPKLSPRIKAQSWETSRKYLAEARKYNNIALDHANSFEREFIVDTNKFLTVMEEISQKPIKKKPKYK
jgi:tetratricopeptide (TPR) repeat protein